MVSGWRGDRQDRGMSRVLPSSRQLADPPHLRRRLHDFGCTLKAYRRHVFQDLRLYGEMHRFVPVHVQIQGGAITEMVVNHRPREFGRSKYGFGRVYKVVLDLLLSKFFASYAAKPIHVFGGFGLLCLLASLVPTRLAFFFKFTWVAEWQKDFVETPLPVVSAVLRPGRIPVDPAGSVAEVLMRTYFESQEERTYSVRRVTTRRPRSGGGPGRRGSLERGSRPTVWDLRVRGA